jgi:ABC-type multidrug transport system ATPase subunit
MTGIWESSSEVGAAALLRIALRQRRPDSGRVLCHGRDLFSWQGRKTRVSAALSPATRIETSHDVLAYVTLAGLWRLSPRAAEIEAYEVLERVGIRDLAAAKPEWLSSTERTCLSLAFVMMSRPEVLLAEKPAAAFGPQKETLAVLRAYAEQHAAVVLITTSDLADLHHCHDRLLLHGGRIVAPSPKVELLVPDTT